LIRRGSVTGTRQSSTIVFDLETVRRQAAQASRSRPRTDTAAAEKPGVNRAKSLADQVFGAGGLDHLQEMAEDAHVLMIRVTPRSYLGLTRGRQEISPLRIDNYLFIFAPHDEPADSLAPLLHDLLRGGPAFHEALDASESGSGDNSLTSKAA
jgi:hypothetical protein